MARVLFSTLGSYGDLYPYLAVGARVQRLGHRVSIATSPTYRAKVESAGLDFVPVRPDMSLENRELMEYLFHQRWGTERVVREVSRLVPETFEDTLPAAEQSDLLITHPLSFAAVLAAEKLKKPWVSSVLAPISFLSVYDPPVPAPFPSLIRLRVFGPGFLRPIFRLSRHVSRLWVKPVDTFRGELGLAPGGHPIFEGAVSSDLMLALFSPQFAQPQPDWPTKTKVTGFPFFNAESQVLPSEVEAFFHSGPAPVVFTLGSSAVGVAGRFYSDSLDAVVRLGVRALFLTGSHPQELPKSLPDNVMVWSYAPHAAVFARASAIVHQGGIGTTAQALASGHPSLVVPFAHDQFDNAERVRRLSAGLALPRPKYNARSAEAALRRLLSERQFTDAASAVGSRIRAEDGAGAAAAAIDNLIAAKGIS